MLIKNTVLSILQANRSCLFEKYHLVDMALFGSVARGEQDANDVDILITCNDEFMIYDLFDLEDELTILLNTKVDVVLKSGIKPYFTKTIADDLIVV